MGSRKRLEIMPQVIDTTQRRITLNVGGQKHETYLSTIRNYPDTRLYWVVENVTKTIDYHPEKIELFFDRHPGIFALVLNYYRTGKLHCPNDVCGPLFEEELAYWGIDEKDMEPCCWTTYIQHRDAENNLKSFNVVDFEPDCEDEGDKQKENELDGKSSKLYTMWSNYQPKIWPLLEEPRSSKAAKAFSIVSVILIVLSVAASCAMTLPDLSEPKTDAHKLANSLFEVIEYVCGIWFTIELVARIIFCPNKRKFFKSFSFWIDLLSVIPFYIRILQEMVIEGDRRLADALLVIRLLRLFRFFRLLYGLQVLLHTLKASSYELFLLLIILLIPVILFSSIIFYVEKSLDGSTKFRSIPESFWWSLITMTTVGYGDMTPSSWGGKMIGGACAIFGVLMVALPISVIGSNFNLYYAHAQARLKLPRKKNRFHFDSLTTAMSRDALRRRGLRKRNPRFSNSEDATSICSRANSAVRGDVRSWSIASSGKSTLDQVVNDDRNSKIPFSKRKISRERRISRNERSPKLGDLLEHENETDGLHSESISSSSRTTESTQERASLTKSLPIQDKGSARNLNGNENAVSRLRSYSMPSNATKMHVPRKSRSESSNLCDRCSLPKDERLENENTRTFSCELCQCSSHRSSGRDSLSFTIVIPTLEGQSDWIEVSTENIRNSYPRSTSYHSDGYMSNRSTNNDDDDELSQLRTNSFLTNDSDDDSTEERHVIDGSTIPLLYLDKSNNNMSNKNTLEHETSI